MANVIKAHTTGTVLKIEVKPGDSVSEGTVESAASSASVTSVVGSSKIVSVAFSNL